MKKLYDMTKEYNIPIIGMNRRYINKSLKQLESVINQIYKTHKKVKYYE